MTKDKSIRVMAWSRRGTCPRCGQSIYDYYEGNRRHPELVHGPGKVCTNPEEKVAFRVQLKENIRDKKG